MEKSEIKVLIVEDDVNFGRGLVEAFKKSGFGALQAAKPDDAINASKMQVIHAYVIDCLLPKISGVELATKLREQVGDEVPIVLTSGIYKDKSFEKEAVAKTKSIAFLEKPFDVAALIKTVEDSLGSIIDEPLDPFYGLLVKTNTTPIERIKALPKNLHGYELPRVISYMMNPAVRGTLTLVDSGETSSIRFADGKIVKVNVKDPESYFGSLLVEKGFLTAEELELTLSATSNKKVGERLVDANLISPHVIAVISSEQMAIRLSKLVKDTSYDASFTEDQSTVTDVVIDQNLFYSFLSEWIRSKIGGDWLRTFYMQLAENKIIKSPQYSDSHPIYNFPPLINYRSQVLKWFGETNIQQLLNEHSHDEDLMLFCVHQLVLASQISFDRSSKAVDPTTQLTRLKRIRDDMKNKNHFEILGINQKSKPAEIKRAYHDLAKVFHPDKLPPTTPKEIVDLARDIFSKMTVAYETLNNEQTRANYVKELEKGRAEKIFQSEGLFEEGKRLLRSGQSSKALDVFKQAIALRPPPSELILYFLWARLMLLHISRDQQKELTDIEFGLGKIPPEERHTAIYYFVKGLLQKFLGDPEQARRNIEHALSLTPNFVEAQRELNVLKAAKTNKTVDIFRDDLSTVVSHLFKKRK